MPCSWQLFSQVDQQKEKSLLQGIIIEARGLWMELPATSSPTHKPWRVCLFGWSALQVDDRLKI